MWNIKTNNNNVNCINWCRNVAIVLNAIFAVLLGCESVDRTRFHCV
jgi:hypothetical protein